MAKIIILNYLRIRKPHYMERFLAKRLYGQEDAARGGSRPAIIIAKAGIALGLAVMIVAMAVTRGFKGEIRGKVTDFSQHIRVSNYRTGSGVIEIPVTCTDSVLDALQECPDIVHVQRYIDKPCIVRTDTLFQGLILKGIGSEYDRSFYEKYMVMGGFPEPADSTDTWIVLSRPLALRLGLDVGDRADVYFMQERIRMRRMTVTGIFETNFSDYDNHYGIADRSLLQRLNGWNGDECSGIELRLVKADDMERSYLHVTKVMNKWGEDMCEQYLVQTMNDMNTGLFAWLDVLDLNVWIILALMSGIAGFTMISGLLIIIFERTSTIGILKAIGASDGTVRKVFLRLASFIIIKGMVIGNLIGIGLCVIQKLFRIVPLDPANYYLDCVPIHIGVGWLVLLNAVMFTLSMLMMLVPCMVISRIVPSRTIRFE